ncbi:MAG: biopolymer transporter ExbD [Pseudomonadales bacterium]|nr:biopolymer transporter ExbD [Pseudomonadales bacterium]
MSFKIKRKPLDEAELDVTSFMNLMIVLVPVLLLSLTFTHVTVLELNLPQLSGGGSVSDQNQSQLEVVVKNTGFSVYYPAEVLVKEIPATVVGGVTIQDYTLLSQVMQELKKELVDKRDVLIRSEGEVDYQNLVTTMDVVKSYKAVITASLVEIELFPEISLGDAS